MDDTLYKAFLEELAALEKFRMGYTALHPAPLGREDQDVRRLTEALALFTARTRLAGQRSIARSTMRLFQQHFPYVLSPVPTMAMLRAESDGQFADLAEVPRGTQVHLAPAKVADNTSPLSFRTQAPLRVLPIRLEKRVRKESHEGRARLLLTFKSNNNTERTTAPGTLRLYLNHLNEFLSSLAVHHQLKTSTRAVSVSFDAENAQWQPCTTWRFQPSPPPPSELEPFEHPLQRIRSFFLFPQQELFLEVELPEPQRPWRQFTLCFELKEPLPPELVLTSDSFVLHATPMVNVQRAMSNPLEHDGTKEHYAIQHTDPTGGYRVHSVLGIYRLDGKGLVPLRPGAFSRGPNTYEIEHEGEGEGRRTWLTLDLPGAFAKPVRVAVEACWYQPLPPEFDVSGYRAGLPERFIEGLRWSVVGDVATGMDNPLERDQQELLHLLSIRNQRFLELDDLIFLLNALGVRDARYFRAVVERMNSLQVRSKPFAKSTTGFKYVYRLTLSKLDTFLVPTVDLFSARLLELLKVWSTEEVVELEVSIPNLELELTYPPREVAR
jgi:type VI secretion system protein ImpG